MFVLSGIYENGGGTGLCYGVMGKRFMRSTGDWHV